MITKEEGVRQKMKEKGQTVTKLFFCHMSAPLSLDPETSLFISSYLSWSSADLGLPTHLQQADDSIDWVQSV